MAEFSEQLLTQTPQAAPPSEGFAETLLSGELPSQTVLPGEAGFTTTFKAGIVDDPLTRMKIFAETRFPDDPNAMQRFGILNDEIVFLNEENKLERASGGFVDFLGTLSADLPEIVAGTAAGIATKSPVVGSAFGGVVGKVAKQVAAGAIFDEPQTRGSQVSGQLREFGFGLTGGLVGEGIVKFLNRNVAREGRRLEGAAREEAIQVIRDVQRETGIELDIAQVTNLPLLKAMKKWAIKFPGKSSEILEAFRLMQDGQSEIAVRRIMETLADETDITEIGLVGINAARMAIEAGKAEAGQIVSPLYIRAFAENPAVDVGNVVGMIDDILQVAKGGRKKVLNSLLREFEANVVSEAEEKAAKETGEKILESNLEALHNVKMQIDSLIDGDADVAIDRFLAVDLQNIQQQLLNSMDNVSDLYAKGRFEHEKLLKRLVDPLRDGVVGTLARLPDSSAASAAAKMFSSRNVSPAQIGRAKRAIQALERTDPNVAGAWEGLVKQWLEDSFNKASKELQTGQVVNFAGKFRQAVFGTTRQKLAMQQALGTQAFRRFNQIMDAFEMMARTPTGGSDTAFNELVTTELSKPSSILRTILSPRGTVMDAIDNRFMQQNAEKIAAALTDPASITQLKQLTKIPSSKEQNLRIVLFILGLETGELISGGLTTAPELQPTAPDQQSVLIQ